MQCVMRHSSVSSSFWLALFFGGDSCPERLRVCGPSPAIGGVLPVAEVDDFAGDGGVFPLAVLRPPRAHVGDPTAPAVPAGALADAEAAAAAEVDGVDACRGPVVVCADPVA